MNLTDIFKALTPARRGGSTVTGTRAPRAAAFPGVPNDAYERDRNPDLIGRKRYAAFQTMRRRVPVASAYWGLVESLAQRAVFTVDAPEDRTEFVFAPLVDSWPRALGDLSEAMMVGMAATEWTAAAVGGRYALSGLRRIPPGSIEEFALDEDGRVDGFAQRVDGRLTVVPRWKTMYVVDGHGHEGEGALSDCAEDALSYIRQKKVLLASVESNLRDIPDFAIDPQADSEDAPFAVAAREAVKNKSRHANIRVVLPSDVQTVLAADGSERPVSSRRNEAIRHDPVPIADNDVLASLSKDMAVSLGVQSLLLGQDGAGSLALAKVESQTLHQRLNGVLGLMAREVERMVSTLFAFNGWPAAKVSVDVSGWRDPDDLATLLTKLNGVNAERYGEAVNDILTQAGLPLPEDAGGSEAGDAAGEDTEDE